MVCLLAVMLGFVCVCAGVLWLLFCGCMNLGCSTVVCVWVSYCGMCVAVFLWYVCGCPTVVCCCSSVVCVWVSYCGMHEAVLLWYM